MQIKAHPLTAPIGVPSAAVDAMAQSIRERGLVEPITLYQGMVLDGRLRLSGANKLVLSRFEFSDDNVTVFDGTWAEAVEFVRARFLATIDTRFPGAPPGSEERLTNDVLTKLAALAAHPLPDPDPADLPVIPPSHASLMAALDTLQRRAEAFIASDIAAHRRSRRPKAYERILAVISRSHEVADAITTAQVRAFLDNPPE